MKATLHIGRGTVKHNDRNFNLDKATHIDQTRKNENFYINRYMDNTITFEECERRYYQENYLQGLEAQNEKYRKRRQYGYVRSIDDLMKAEKTQPKEMILQIGNKDNQPDKEILLQCIYEFNEEFNKRYGTNAHILNIAIHNDEKTSHAHIRFICDYTAKDGVKKICTDKALKELGIKPPKEKEKTDRYNNALQTFTEQIRFIWNTIIKRNGIEIDETVINPSRKHLTVLEYKDKKLQEEIENHNKQIAGQGVEIRQKQNEIYTLDKQISTKKKKIKELEEKLYSNAQGENFKNMCPVFDEER
ncbi:MAG: hypothetical protein IKY94_09875 [Lachnospiraceae bacterium]|nr:hypothetical protein [Lachnospiraceae bacterium]